MAAFVTVGIKDTKCASCNWWCGKRQVDFRNNRPFYVKAEAGAASCMAQTGQMKTPGNACPRWTQWEKIR